MLRNVLVGNKMLANLAIEMGFADYIRYFLFINFIMFIICFERFLPTEALEHEGRARTSMLADTMECNIIFFYDFF